MYYFQYYAKHVPHPHALVLAEEMFEAGYIPSDTDFRIFRDFGRLPGMYLIYFYEKAQSSYDGYFTFRS